MFLILFQQSEILKVVKKKYSQSLTPDLKTILMTLKHYEISIMS